MTEAELRKLARILTTEYKALRLLAPHSGLDFEEELLKDLRGFQRKIRQEIYAELLTWALPPEVIKQAAEKVVSREWDQQ